MKKARKAAKKAVRNSIDWALLFRLVGKGASNAEVAEKMGRPFGSEPEQKAIRAMVSRAKTIGVRLEGKMCKLRVPKDRNRSDAEAKPKAKVRKATKKASKPKAEPKPAIASLAATA